MRLKVTEVMDQPSINTNDQFIIVECSTCKTKNRIPNPPRLTGTYRCGSCKRTLQIRQASESEGPNDAAGPTEEYEAAISERQIKIEAAKEAAALSLCLIFFGGLFILLFISEILSRAMALDQIGLVALLSLLLWGWLYNRKLGNAKEFIARVNRIKELLSNNQTLQAKREIAELDTPLKVLVGLRSQVLGEVQRTVEKHDRLQADEQKRKKEEQEQKQREELFKQIHSQEILDSISPQEFELVVLEAFARLGYQASHTPWSGDEGIDGILLKGEKKTAVQCKKHKNTVGQPYLRDFLGAMVHAKCEEGIFVTTSDFSDGARMFAKANKTKLIDGKETIDLLRQTITEDFVMNGRLVKFPPKVEEKACPRCGGHLRRKLGIKGFFWGCSNFPKCRYTEDWTSRGA